MPSARDRAAARKKKWKRYAHLAARWKRLYRQAKAKIKPKPKAGQLTEHFNVSEFACNDGTPAPKANYDAMRRLAKNVLEPLRAKFGPCHINSGYRHRAYNARIGGATQSYHIYDLRPSCAATDVTFQNGTPSQWAAEARRLGAGGVGTYSSFVHVDNGPARAWAG